MKLSRYLLLALISTVSVIPSSQADAATISEISIGNSPGRMQPLRITNNTIVCNDDTVVFAADSTQFGINVQLANRTHSTGEEQTLVLQSPISVFDRFSREGLRTDAVNLVHGRKADEVIIQAKFLNKPRENKRLLPPLFLRVRLLGCKTHTDVQK